MSITSIKCVKIQNSDFFKKSADEVAKELLGKIICRKMNDGFIMRGRITETVAYFGNEPFCYGYGDKNQKNKNHIFYSVGNVCYYNNMLMISCLDEFSPDNVLIRSIELYNGPENVVEALDINEELNTENFTSSDVIWIEENATKVDFVISKRINIQSNNKCNFKVTSLNIK